MHGQVAHEIGRQIVSGAIAEGDFLPRESELSEQFSVSRQAIREALKVLAAKGLVNSRRRAGTHVMPRATWNLLDPDVLAWHPPAELSPQFLNDLVELRRLLEPAAARMSAERGEPARLAGITAALDKMRRSVGDAQAFYAADAEFHVAIFAASGNTLVDRLSTILGPLLEASFRLQGIDTVFAFEESVTLHEGVYDAIVKGDAARAVAAMEDVLAVASERISAVVPKGRSED